jgi:hypothetical protein
MGLTIADFMDTIEFSLEDSNDHYHTHYLIPDWFLKELQPFIAQVQKMASQKKPFKATDYFKIKAGYPHEVVKEQKERLIQRGCSRDILSSKYDVTIPKMDIQTFVLNYENVIGFTTPKDSQFVRDITIYDIDSHDNLAFIYIVNRKAQVIAGWSEKKVKGKYQIKKPDNLIKNIKYKK